MSVRWPYWIPTLLTVVLTLSSAKADDDKKEGKGRGKGGDKKESRDRGRDDEFEKRFHEQNKRYEEQRREGQKRYEEQQREGQKRDGEWQRKLEEQYREDQKRQDKWRKDAEKDGRKHFEEQLKRQMRNDGRLDDRHLNFGPVSPPMWPPFGSVLDQNRLPVARRAAAEFGPEFARALAGLEAGGSGFDARAIHVVADLVRRSERLSELARRDADLGAIRQEYTAVDTGWRQLAPYLDQAVVDPGTRELAWRLYLTERQLRVAIGYDARAAGPNWAFAQTVARDQSTRLGQLVTMARQDSQLDVNLIYDLRNAQREAQAFEELVAGRVRAEELRAQHEYFATALAQANGQLQAVYGEGPVLLLVHQVVVADRQLCVELGLPVYQDDSTREVIARAGELRVAADRLRRDFWVVLGSSDKDVIAYYVQPSDQLAAHTDLIHQMLVEGRPMELVQAGWQHVMQLNDVVGQRVQMLEQRQFPSIHQLAADTGRLVQEVNTFFVPDRLAPPFPRP